MNTKVSILLAEDDHDDVSIFTEVINGVLPVFNLHVAHDGCECISQLKNGVKPDLIFLDINLPFRNGIQCLQKIKQMDELTETPVIMCTTSQVIKDIDTCFKNGAALYIVKPSSGKVYTRLMKQAFHLLGQPRAEMQKKENFVLMEKTLRN